MICSIVFNEYNKWETHLTNIHLTITTMYPNTYCEICSIQFRKTSSALHHLLMVHSSMEITCAYCEGNFSSETSFEDHFGGYLDPCPKCNQCSCMCGPPSDDSYEYLDHFDENDFISKYMKYENNT